jgi:hypothetical protein
VRVIQAQTRFKKGQSGNPKGRPVGHSTKLATDALRLALNRKAADGDRIMLNVVAEALVNKAADGDVQAIREIFDRIEGKVTQRAEFTGAEGGPIQIEGENARDVLMRRIAGIASRQRTAND